MPKRITALRQVSEPDYESDEILVTLDARAVAEAVAEAVAVRHREAIEAGERPSGGPQERTRDGEARGKGEGRFSSSIDAEARGGDLKASAVMGADPYFDAWLSREASRGVEYLEIDGQVDELMDAVLQEVLDE